MQLQISEIVKSFGEKSVLKGISFEVERGKALGILGRNGAGKTTTIRIIMGVFPPDSGHIYLDGNTLNRDKVAIGYLPEEHGLYPKIAVGEQLLYLARLRGMSSKDAKESMNYWLKRLEMHEYTNKQLITLSKGNQQKIQLAATLLTNPDLVILDEPFSGLDPVNAALLKDTVKELIDNGKMVLFSSHQMGYVEEFCDAIAILHDGKIVLSGNIGEIKRSYNRNVLSIRSLQNEAIAEYCMKTTELVAYVNLKKDTLLVTLKRVEDKNFFIASLAAQRFDIDSVGVHEPSLEDIFVQYTGESLTERKETL